MDELLSYSRAEALLRVGRFSEAWPLYEARREVHPETLPRVTASAPEWSTQDIAGKRIVVCAEGGLGDQLMFGRFLPLLARHGAQVVIAADRRLLPLFHRCGLEIEGLQQDHQVVNADYWTFLGSIPLRLGLSEMPPARYIPCTFSGGGGVGVMTSGNSSNLPLLHRSLPPAEAGRLQAIGRDLHPDATGFHSLAPTADLITTLDLVVSIDTSVAHLALALGAPCWVLTPWKLLDWRWGTGHVSPWYPEARLFRQDGSAEWRPVVDQVLDALKVVV